MIRSQIQSIPLQMSESDFILKFPQTPYFVVYFLNSPPHLNFCVDSLMLAHISKWVAFPLPLIPDRHCTWSQAVQCLLLCWLWASSLSLFKSEPLLDSFKNILSISLDFMDLHRVLVRLVILRINATKMMLYTMFPQLSLEKTTSLVFGI